MLVINFLHTSSLLLHASEANVDFLNLHQNNIYEGLLDLEQAALYASDNLGDYSCEYNCVFFSHV
jgi:hypothetical protein